MSESLIIYSFVPRALKERLLYRGFYFALPGSLALIGPGQPFAFFLGIALIAAGLIPYKRSCRLENRPISLRCLPKHIEIHQKGRQRELAIEQLRGFSQEGTFLKISWGKEDIRLAHFPPGTAKRIEELYF